jgi:hypothetical protein
VKALSHFCASSSKPTERVQAKGLLMQLQQFNFVFILHVLDAILPILSGTSKYMQGKSADVANILTLVNSVIAAIQSMKSSKSFSELFQAVSNFCQSEGITVPYENNVPLPVSDSGKTSRRRRPPGNLQDFVLLSNIGNRESNMEAGPEDLGREMFEILDKFSRGVFG